MRYPHAVAATILLIACDPPAPSEHTPPDVWTDAEDPPSPDAPWTPEIENLGSDGWRSSTGRWCPDLEFPIWAIDVWSHDDAVYVLAADSRDTGMTYEDVNHIYVNDGTGWSTVYEEPASNLSEGDLSSCFHQIRGSADGPLYLWQGPSHPCNLSWFEDGTISSTDFMATEIFVVSEDRVLAMSTVGLMRWDGSHWVRDHLDGGPWHSHAWADEESLFVATDDGIVREFTGGAWTDHDSGTYHSLGTIWGFSRTDVWVASGMDLIHYDGTSWTRVDWPGPDPEYSSINHMWGADGVLFLATVYQLFKYEDGTFTELLDLQGKNLFISSIWGNSPTELFIAAHDPDWSTGPCSRALVLRWDGTEFHWL